MRFVSFVIGLFALIGVVLVGGIATVAVVAAVHTPKPPKSMVLEMVLDGGLAETTGGGLDRLINAGMAFDEILDALERARHDPRVKGLIARLGSAGPAPAQAQELREAVRRFRESGRFAFVYAGSYGNTSYLLASAFDEVWMQPLGLFALTGPSAQVPFARAALDSLGLLPEIEKREQYKSAPDTATEYGLTPAHREMLESIVGDLGRQISEAVAESRHMAPDAVRTLIDRAPLTDREAFDARLIDHLGYRDEMEARADEKSGGADVVDIGDYYGLVDGPYDTGPTVAVIHAVGSIVDGETEDSNSDTVTPGRLASAFADAADDTAVRAILFRIDSGGGSVTASESIRRAIVKAREAGKRVVVSMGATAASGGYWIALPADRIVADPATLTGSIGVFAGKISAADLSQRLGIAWGEVSGGKNATMWSPVHPFTPGEKERVAAYADAVYDAFVTRVAEARHMPLDAVQEAARGRVWTGAQALDRGLVDELGGRDRALAVIRGLIGVKPDSPIALVPYPEEPSALQQLINLAGQDSGWLMAARAVTSAPLVKRWVAALADAAQDINPAVQARAPHLNIQ